MKKAFTILELLVVVAIIAILAVVAVPSFLGRIDEAQDAKYLAEISSVKTATSSYFIENGSYPTEQGDQPTLGDPKNIKFSSLISGGFLTKLPTFSNWYIDYIGQVIHTEDTWQTPTAQLVVTDTKTGTKITLGTNFKGTEPHPEATKAEDEGGDGGDPEPDLSYTGTDFATEEFDGTLAIMAYTGESKDVIIPSKINGKTVTTIGDSAFYDSQLTSVTIPNSVTSIGDYAFSSNQLTSVTIPNSVTAIGEFALQANNLSSITLPNSVTSIGGRAFASNKITSITIPDSLTYIDDRVFYDNLLTSVTIPDSVTYIGTYAFSGNQLTSVTISNSVTLLETSVFSDNLLTSVTIPNSVTRLSSGAFENNLLTSVTIPANVTVQLDSISSTFHTAYNSEKGAGTYTAPSQAGPWINETLGYTGTDFTTTESAGVLTITGYTGASKDVTIPSKINGKTVTSIGAGAFAGKELTSVTIPDSVTSIGNDAFYYNQLTSVTIPNSVTSIGDRAFIDNQLTSVTIPNSVTTIGEEAFIGNQLKSVTIPANVAIKSGSISGTFETTYNANSKTAGTYTAPYQTGVWTKQP